MSILSISPCIQVGCFRCCLDTEMTLSEEDIQRIDALGFKGYYQEVDGYIQLNNIDGHCFFLRDGRCLINRDKPLGCKLYPLVLDVRCDEVFVHSYCEHAKLFEYDEEDAQLLKKTIDTEESERKKRLERRSCKKA